MQAPPTSSRVKVGHASSGVIPFFASSASWLFMPRQVFKSACTIQSSPIATRNRNIPYFAVI